MPNINLSALKLLTEYSTCLLFAQPNLNFQTKIWFFSVSGNPGTHYKKSGDSRIPGFEKNPENFVPGMDALEKNMLKDIFRLNFF